MPKVPVIPNGVREVRNLSRLSLLCDLCVLSSVNVACPDRVGVLPSFFDFFFLSLPYLFLHPFPNYFPLIY